MFVTESKVIWNALNGVICMFKPAGVTCNQTRKALVSNICKELCEMKCRDPINHVSITGATNNTLAVNVEENYADNPLVVGPRYQPNDVRCTWVSHLGRQTSGVLLFGINEGTKLAFSIRQSKPTRAYKVNGKLGEATENYFKEDKIIEKTTFAHVKRHNMDKLLSSMQAIHQSKMFELCGVDIKSQAAYELAIKGPIRPSDSKIPLLYGIKCVIFDPPHFTIEVQCINEYEMYLKTLIHEIGMQLRSTAHCTAIQCIRHGHFTTENAALLKHTSLQHVLNNMNHCATVIHQDKNVTRRQSISLT